MSANLEYAALTRLLTLNNQVHDLENQLKGISVPRAPEFPGLLSAAQNSKVPYVVELSPRSSDQDGGPTFTEDASLNSSSDAPFSELYEIAGIQERIDQGVRASLTTCWLGMPENPGY